jgi:hypothetical protein
VASQQDYLLPYNCGKLSDVKVTVSSTNYYPIEEKIRQNWILLNTVTETSDIPYKYYTNPNSVSLFPIPSSASNTITYYFQKTIRDMATTNDYSTGKVSTTAGNTTITGSGTSFTAKMVGQYITFDDDSYFYEITAFTDATHITIGREAHSTIAGGAFSIGDVTPLPDGFEDLPLYYALSVYFTRKEKTSVAKQWKETFDEGIRDLMNRGRKATDNLVEQDDIIFVDPNDDPTLS